LCIKHIIFRPLIYSNYDDINSKNPFIQTLFKKFRRIMRDQHFTITLSCKDRPAIVATITSKLAELDVNIAQSDQYWDKSSDRFFMRIAFDAPTNLNVSDIEKSLALIIKKFDMQVVIKNCAKKPKIIIMVSKFDHAMSRLLYQIKTQRLNAQVVAIVSNHENAREIADFEKIDFYHLPITKENKKDQEKNLLDLVEKTDAELIVLARYMQILSDDFATQLYGKIINIHHSFLPSFKGAKPYHQAFDRGVKIIGATAHYVTGDLDEGPIIVQDIAHINHAYEPKEMIEKGEDIESRVLAAAVKLHLEQRVMLNGKKTVVFD
jgi:formyltetrahydrofolate deformylase